MPSSMMGSEPPNPVPYQPNVPHCRESQEQRRSSSRRASSSLSERRWSGPHPNRLTSPLSHSFIPSSSLSPSVTKAHDSDEGRGGFGWVKLIASAADELFVHLHSLRFCRYHPRVRGFPTPHRISGSFQPSHYRIPTGHRVILVILDCWFRTPYQTLLTSRQFEIDQ